MFYVASISNPVSLPMGPNNGALCTVPCTLTQEYPVEVFVLHFTVLRNLMFTYTVAPCLTFTLLFSSFPNLP